MVIFLEKVFGDPTRSCEMRLARHHITKPSEKPQSTNFWITHFAHVFCIFTTVQGISWMVFFRIHFITNNIGLGFPFLPSVKLYYSLALFPDISYSTMDNNPQCMIDIVVLLYPLQCEFTLYFEMHGIKLENLEWRWKCHATLSDILMRKKQACIFLSSISQGCCVFHM